MPPPMISVSTFVEQIAEQIELGGDLGAADDGRDRTLRRVQRFLQRFELLLHGAPGIGGKQMGDRFDEACARCATEKASST